MDGYRDKIHQRGKVLKNLGDKKSKSLCKKSEKIHKNREKNLPFYGVKQSKIRWTVIEIKFIKGEKFLKIWEMIN